MDILIQHTSDRMVYRVQSERTAAYFYRVDLLANHGGGWCSCFDFSARRQPFVDRGGDPWSREGSCKHIQLARDFFLKNLLEHMAKAYDAG